MEDYRKKIRLRLTAIIIASIVIIVIGVLFISAVNRPDIVSYNDDGSVTIHHSGYPLGRFIFGFRIGCLLALLGALIIFAIRYAAALRDAEQLRRLQIEENDERRQYIKLRTGSIGMNTALFGLILATIIAGQFNEAAFYSLLGASLFVALIKAALKIYYRKIY